MSGMTIIKQIGSHGWSSHTVEVVVAQMVVGRESATRVMQLAGGWLRWYVVLVVSGEWVSGNLLGKHLLVTVRWQEKYANLWG